MDLNRFVSANISVLVKCQITAVHLLQKAFDYLDRKSRPWFVRRFQHKNVSSFYFSHNTGVPDDRQAMFTELRETLRDACSIQIAVGEMGHQLMEHPILVTILQSAARKQHAKIDILHGPNVDPKTQSVFRLAREGSVRLYKTSRYYLHHFMVIEHSDGSWSVVDERRHNETLWSHGKSGNLVELIRGSGRLYYLMKRSNRRVRGLREEFEVRKRGAIPSFDNPGITRSQDITSLSSTGTFLLSFPFKIFLQPWSVYKDTTLDIDLWPQPVPKVKPVPVTGESEWEQRKLPKTAQKWMRAQLANLNMTTTTADEVSLQEDCGAAGNDVPGRVHASVRVFRDLHFMRYPETSIASLSISDEVFLDLVWLEIYTVDELERYLQDEISSVFRSDCESFSNSGEAVATLSEAISEWHTSKAP